MAGLCMTFLTFRFRDGWFVYDLFDILARPDNISTKTPAFRALNYGIKPSLANSVLYKHNL